MAIWSFSKPNDPDVQRRASELLATLGPRVSAVEADFAKRLGWTPNRANQIWETNPGYKAKAKDFSQITTGAMRS